jgi:hypothetical protein
VTNRAKFVLAVLEVKKRGCKCDPTINEKRRPYRVQFIHQERCPLALRAVS